MLFWVVHYQPGQASIGLRRAALAGLLLMSLALTFLLWSTASAGSQFDISPPRTPAGSDPPPSVSTPDTAAPARAPRHYLPLLSEGYKHEYQCPTTSAMQWDSMVPTQRFIAGAASSPDLNMNVRGWHPVDDFLGFVRYPYPPVDPPDRSHPLHLSAITGGAASFVSTYQVNEWDWLGCNCGVPRSSSPYPVTMLGLRTIPGQPLHVPSRDVTLDPRSYTAIVMYADARQLAVKYSSEDRVDNGYLVHLLNLCVDPNLVALYQRLDADGRQLLPVVDNNSIIGAALDEEVRVIVRDRGDFLDPRSWQDWWQDQPPPAG